MRMKLWMLLPLILTFSAPLVSADPHTLKDKAVKKLTLASPPADDDRLIPGWRAGPLHLGMSTAQLLAAKGEPDQTHARGSSFSWGGTYIQTLNDGKVISISVGWNNTSSAMKTAEGLGVGSSQIAIAAALGQPEWRTVMAGALFFCYERGIAFEFPRSGDQSRASQVHIVNKVRSKWLCSSK